MKNDFDMFREIRMTSQGNLGPKYPKIDKENKLGVGIICHRAVRSVLASRCGAIARLAHR